MNQSIILLILTLSIPTVAQKLEMQKSFLGSLRFLADTLEVSPRQVLEIMERNPVARAEFKKGMVINNVGAGVGFCGGVLVGAPIVMAILGGEMDWGLLAVGGTLIGGSFALESVYRRKSRGAIDLYNNRSATAKRTRVNLNLAITGVALQIRF